MCCEPSLVFRPHRALGQRSSIAFRISADIGIQSVITLIDSDLPPSTEKEGPVFTTVELILTLHDENEQGSSLIFAAVATCTQSIDTEVSRRTAKPTADVAVDLQRRLVVQAPKSMKAEPSV